MGKSQSKFGDGLFDQSRLVASVFRLPPVHGDREVHEGRPTLARKKTPLLFVQDYRLIIGCRMQIDSQFLLPVIFQDFEAAPLVSFREKEESAQTALTKGQLSITNVP